MTFFAASFIEFLCHDFEHSATELDTCFCGSRHEMSVFSQHCCSLFPRSRSSDATASRSITITPQMQPLPLRGSSAACPSATSTMPMPNSCKVSLGVWGWRRGVVERKSFSFSLTQFIVLPADQIDEAVVELETIRDSRDMSLCTLMALVYAEKKKSHPGKAGGVRHSCLSPTPCLKIILDFNENILFSQTENSFKS